MKFATIVFQSQPRLAVCGRGGELYLLDELLHQGSFDAPYPRSMLELIERPSTEQASIKQVVASSLSAKEARVIQPEAWLPPVIRPSKIVGVAINNAGLARFAYRYFENPTFFLKAASSLIGHERSIKIRRSYGLTHPEPELACVIGRPLSYVSKDEVLEGLFGYTIINDVTSVGLKDQDSVHFQMPVPFRAPSWRRKKSLLDGDVYLTYHARSKSTDTFGPIGPYLVTADEILDPNNLQIRSWMGEELIAEDSTANLKFGIETVISHLSGYLSLEPGDIVHMGTAVKAGLPTLRHHDLRKKRGPCSIEIENLGRLINPIEVLD